MKIPEKAPTIGELLKKGKHLNPDLSDLAMEYNRRYLHWDDLRYRDCGDDREGLWLMMKMMRSNGFVITIGDSNFEFHRIHEMDRILHEMDMSLSQGFSPTSTIKENEQLLYSTSTLMEESIASSQLEGASTTRKAAKRMLRDERAPETKSERMILNNYQAMSFIKTRLDEQLTPDLILQIHSIISDGLMEDPSYEGNFRTDDSIAVRDIFEDRTYHVPVTADRIPCHIKDLCQFVNSEEPFIHPLVKGAMIHFILAYIHPFMDGNGRVSRALFYWYALKKKYAIIEYLTISKTIKNHRQNYDLAFLRTEKDSNDLTYFVKFNMDILVEARDLFVKYLERKIAEQADVIESGKKCGLNYRQCSILEDIVRKNESVDTYYISNKFQITTDTARRDIIRLEQLGLVKESGRDGHRKIYSYTGKNI